jgi:hypothetical protein
MQCALLVEDEERRLRPWDFFHSSPWTLAHGKETSLDA